MSEAINRKKPVWIIVLLSFFVLLLILSIAGYIYINSKLNLINRPVHVVDILPEDEFFEIDEDDLDVNDLDENGKATNDDEKEVIAVVDPKDVIWTEDEKALRDKNIINILLIGQDKGPRESRGRSDSMMIATINKKNNTIKVTSIMRDMYVQIPGYSDNRINTAYIFGGMKLLNATIEKNFLIHIDGNVVVDFEGFQKIIDRIGGVEVSVNARDAEYMTRIGFKGVSEGKVHMNGYLALAYSRIRRVGNSDYERTLRQRSVITSVYENMRTLKFSEILSLMNELLPMITTDLTNSEIMSLALTTFSMDLDQIDTSNRIPINGSFSDATIRGMRVLVPDLSKNREALRKIIYGE